MTLELLLKRDNDGALHNWGQFFVNGSKLAETLEDKDRYLETGEQEKVYGETAIPRGRYKVVNALSPHFGRVLPHVLGVPGFDGILLHGGNKELDTLGCPLLGRIRTPLGIADCKTVVEMLIEFIDDAASRGEEAWLTVA